jgi:hypothetical protein
VHSVRRGREEKKALMCGVYDVLCAMCDVLCVIIINTSLFFIFVVLNS